MYTFVVVILCVSGILAYPHTDPCSKIGGVCKDPLSPCTGSQTFYSGLCPRPNYCCAQKTDDRLCRSRGGQCDYKCEGALPFSGLCNGGLSCCIAML